MFGQRENKDDKAGAPAIPPAGTLNSSTGIPDDHAVSQILADTSMPTFSGPLPATNPVNSFMPFSGEPFGGPAPSAASSMTTVATQQPVHVDPPAVSAPSLSSSNMLNMSTDDLVRMKQEALQHLQPLVGTLQQSPEEEFRTLMMMIQATDDRSMLQKALEAAKKIGDDKIRAQAMLDVINEINYFTQVSDQA